jgi:hypothetical protein
MMRLMVVTAITALALSAGLHAQSAASQALPKCMEDAPPLNVDVTDVSIAQVLPFFGAGCGVEIRVEGVEGTAAVRTVPHIRFQQTKISEIFRFTLQAYGLKYNVIDDKTIVVTKQ